MRTHTRVPLLLWSAPRPSPARLRKLLLRLGLVVGGCAFGGLVAELVARTQSASPGEELLFRAPDGALRGMYQPDPGLLTITVPWFTGSISGPGYTVDVRIDGHGMRAAPEGSPAAAPSQTGPVWLAVGDSFTLSLQVAAADTFESRLGVLLGAPVLNAGIDGYSTWQATGRYQQVDAAVGSEVILLTYFLGNDLNDNEVFPKLLQGHSSARPGGGGPTGGGGPSAGPGGAGPGGAGPGGGARRAPGPPGPTILKPGMGFAEGLLFRHSHLYAYLRVASARRALHATDTREAQKYKGELVPFTVAGAGRLAQLVAQSESALREFRDAAAARGDRVLVAVAPPAFAVSEARARDTLGTFGLDEPAVTAPAGAIVDLLARLSIPACDLSPALTVAETAGEAPYLRYDGHWSARGHAVVAQTLAACARAQGLAP